MENLRAAQERDLADCIEGEFGADVTLTDPDGTTYNKNANDLTKNLRAKIRYRTQSVDPETGEPVIIHRPVVTLRITSLTRVPVDGENWLIQMPISPVSGALLKNLLFTPDRAIEDGIDMGFIKMYLVEVEQS